MEEAIFTIPRDDGDIIRIWVRAYDVMGNVAEDSMTAYVDSSPPVIENIWLLHNGQAQLAVHHSRDLFDMM